MKKYYIDLHTHSTYSDGSKEPLQLLEEAKKNNIGILAITDHDNIEGSKELIRKSNKEIWV